MDFFKQSMRLFRSVFPTIHHIRYKLSRKPYFIIDIGEGNYIDPNRKKKVKCMKRYNEKWLKTENFNMKEIISPIKEMRISITRPTGKKTYITELKTQQTDTYHINDKEIDIN